MQTTDIEIAYSASCQQYWDMTLTTKWDFADSARRHHPLSTPCPSVPQPKNVSQCPSVLFHQTDPDLSLRPKWSANCITLTWGFQVCNIDKRVYILQLGQDFVIILVFVDDMAFVSNSSSLLSYIKQRVVATFDVKLFGKLQTFIGWELTYSHTGLQVTQARYTKSLLARFGLEQCNAVYTPLPLNVDLSCAQEDETFLSL